MTSAIGFALLSMLFTGVIDVVYKIYSGKSRSRGLFLCVMGVVWGCLQGAMWLLLDSSSQINFDGIGYGLAAGVFLTLSNIALIEAMAHIPVSLGSTVYRLNTIGVVVLAWLLLGETLTATKLFGLGFGIAAVLVMYHRDRTLPNDGLFVTFCVVAVIASCMRASYGVASKAALSAGMEPNLLILIAAACWITGGLGYSALRERKWSLDWPAARLGLLGGLIVFAIVNTLITALSVGEASVVVPISNLGFLVALVISVAAGWEAMNARKGMAVALAGVAIVLLSGQL